MLVEVVVVVVVVVEGVGAATATGTCDVTVLMTVGRGCSTVGEAEVDGPWSADTVL